MKKIAAIAAMALTFALTGCVQINMDTVIEKNGSGTFTLKYAMSDDVASAIEELQDMDMPGKEDMDEAPTLDDFNKDEIEEACKKYDVKLKKFDRATVDGKQTLEIVLKFKNVNDLSDALASSMEEQGGMKVFKTVDGNYALVAVKPEIDPEEAAEEEEATPLESPQDYDPEQMGKAMEVMGKLMSSMQDLDISMNITVPGKIIEHNAMRVEGQTLIWEINSSNMMDQQANSMEPNIIFSGQGVKIDAPLLEE